jgi:hypothetical protein
MGFRGPWAKVNPFCPYRCAWPRHRVEGRHDGSTGFDCLTPHENITVSRDLDGCAVPSVHV